MPRPEPRSSGVLAARLRMPLMALAVLALVAPWVVDVPSWWGLAALVLLAVAMALYIRIGTPTGPVADVAPPVDGRWLALNSPTTRVPSHRIHAWSQTYAIDLVADPADGSRPTWAWWPVARRPEDHPAFGRTVRAPVSGVVVRRTGFMRDHWSRASPLAFAYFVLESVRELLGPLGVLGNHVVIRQPDGTCVLLAHLRRGSIAVARGQRVDAGEPIAACGNSGNATEPHLHLQAMDGPSTWTAAARPIRFAGAPPPPDGDHVTW